MQLKVKLQCSKQVLKLSVQWHEKRYDPQVTSAADTGNDEAEVYDLLHRDDVA